MSPFLGAGLFLARVGGGPRIGPVPRSACFVAGTLIHTRDGLKPIEEISLTDFVLSRPENDGEQGERRVVNLVRFDDKPILEIVVAGAGGRTETFQATGEHPFWVEGEGWVAASELKADDRLRLADGGDACIASVTDTGTTAAVFNFEVDGWHTYHIGKLGVWVHNADCFVDTLHGRLPYRQVMDVAHRNAESVLGAVPRGRHLHHVSQLRGTAPPQMLERVQRMVDIQHAILARHGINWATDPVNLVHARRGGGVHSPDAVRDLTRDLIGARNGSTADIVEILQEHGRRAARK